MTVKTLTYPIERSILAQYSKRIETVSSKTDYVEKILCYDKLFCYTCGEEIHLGQHYTYSTRGAQYWRKYYHNLCFEGLFH